MSDIAELEQSGSATYCYVAESDVPAVERRAAAAVIDYATRELDLPPIVLHWFRAAADGENVADDDGFESHAAIAGFANETRPGEVWLAVGWPEVAVVGVLAHELRHVAQFVRDGVTLNGLSGADFETTYARCEVEATAFAWQAIDALRKKG